MSGSVRTETVVTSDRVVRGTIELPPAGTTGAPVLLFIPGFKGFAAWGGWPWLTRALAETGFVVHRLDLSMNGVSGESDRHDEPEKFAHNTLGHDLEDLAAVLDAREDWAIPRDVAGDRLGLIGHSRGGVVSLLFGGECPEVDAIATLGAPARAYRKFRIDDHDLWRDQGFLEVPNTRTGQLLHLDVSILDDFERNESRYDVERAVTARPLPTLVLHGRDDESVPVAEGEELASWLPHPRSRLERLATGHTFGFSHPFPGAPEEGDELVSLLRDWFTEELLR